jgi:hypothetical protein
MQSTRRLRVALIVLLVLPPIVIISGTLIREIPVIIMTRDLRRDPNYAGFQILPRGLIEWQVATAATAEETLLDAEALQFLNSHNAMQARIAKAVIDGESLWIGYGMEDIAWPLHLELNRQERTMLVEGKGQRCILKGRTTFVYRGGGYYGSMHTNLLYMSMFWTFDPRVFSAVAERQVMRQDPNGLTRTLDIKVASAEGGELWFDQRTGHLIRLDGEVRNIGRLTVDMYEFATIDESQNIVLPTVVTVKVPDDVFGVPLPARFERVIQLRFSPKDICLEYALEGNRLTQERRQAVPLLGEHTVRIHDDMSKETPSLVLLSPLRGIGFNLPSLGGAAARLR